MPAGGQSEVGGEQKIDQYLERLDGRERAIQKEWVGSGLTASLSMRSVSVVPPPGEIIGQQLVKWHLTDGTPVQTPRRFMTLREIDPLRVNYRIPSYVLLWPLKDKELATNPLDGWMAVHEHQFKCCLTLLLHPWVQQIL